MAREYLRKSVKTWLSNGENIILYIDTSKRTRKIPVGKKLKHLGPIYILEDRHVHLDKNNSWFRCSHHIEGVWVSENITVKSITLLIFGLGIGYLRPIIIEVNNMGFIGDILVKYLGQN